MKYWAFISYSHKDTAIADWLHRKLETYRVPKSLVGTPSREGEVPSRIMPIFRDREELPTSSELGDNLQKSLQQSRYLIVICSPDAAQSRNRSGKSKRAVSQAVCRPRCGLID